jgi:hypothetical protein
MNKMLIYTVCLAASAGFAAAQTKMSGTGKCVGKPDAQQMIEVGDRAGHSLVIVKQTCTWTQPIEIAGLKSKTYSPAVSADMTGDKSQDRGYVTVVMENGDKAIVRFTGSAMYGKDGNPTSDEGTWTFAGGTGKLKGLKGKGTYKGKAGADGFEDTVEGEYTLPAAK